MRQMSEWKHEFSIPCWRKCRSGIETGNTTAYWKSMHERRFEYFDVFLMDYALNGFSFWNVELILEKQEEEEEGKNMAENVELDSSISIWNCHIAANVMCLHARTTDYTQRVKELKEENGKSDWKKQLKLVKKWISQLKWNRLWVYLQTTFYPHKLFSNGFSCLFRRFKWGHNKRLALVYSMYISVCFSIVFYILRQQLERKFMRPTKLNRVIFFLLFVRERI